MADSSAEISGDEDNGFVSNNELLVLDSLDQNKEIVCIEYPGMVINDDNALKTLGGISKISEACTGKGYSFLELNYRPGDSYCKPTIARQSNPCCIAVKVKRRRKKVVTSDGSSRCVSECSGEVLGRVDTMFEFTGMADFQLLPPGLNNIDHADEPIDHNIYQLSELYDESVMSKDLPEFIPPMSVFSKLDRPGSYSYKPDAKHNIGSKNVERPVQQLPGRARLRRPNFAYGITFDSKDGVPCSPKQYTPNSNHPKLPALKQLFEERPVWSRNAIQSKLKITSVICKQLLPLVAYNFISGPWRTLWVKFGYDPRASPDGKKYQSLDFRVPRIFEMSVVAPSKNYQHRQTRPLGVGGENESKWKMGLLQQEEERSMKQAHERLGENPSTGDEDEIMNYIFDPDCLPQQRQQFFQLCDLHADSLQDLIHNNDGKETKCSELTGWCNQDTYEKLRKQIIELITAKAVKDGILLGKQVLTEEGGDSTSS